MKMLFQKNLEVKHYHTAVNDGFSRWITMMSKSPWIWKKKDLEYHCPSILSDGPQIKWVFVCVFQHSLFLSCVLLRKSFFFQDKFLNVSRKILANRFYI